MPHIKMFSVVVLASLMLPGCAWIDEIGEDKSEAQLRLVSASDNLEAQLQCPCEQFPISFYYFDADAPFDGSARIRMFRSAPEAMRTNSFSLLFQKTDADTLESCPAPSEFVGKSANLSRNGCVRAFVQFNGCDDEITAQINGTLMLDEFSAQRGDRVKGSVSGTLIYVEKIETSSQTLEKKTELGQIEGDFSFVNKAGIVWRN